MCSIAAQKTNDLKSNLFIMIFQDLCGRAHESNAWTARIVPKISARCTGGAFWPQTAARFGSCAALEAGKDRLFCLAAAALCPVPSRRAAPQRAARALYRCLTPRSPAAAGLFCLIFPAGPLQPLQKRIILLFPADCAAAPMAANKGHIVTQRQNFLTQRAH